MRKKLKLKWKIFFIIIIILLVTFISARFIGTRGLIIREEIFQNLFMDLK